MRYGYTGSQALIPHAATVCDEVLSQCVGDEHTTGACIGMDTYIYEWLHSKFPEAHHRVIVPANRSRVVLQPTANETIYMPEGSSYRDRNLRILDFTDVLVAFPQYPEDHPRSRRSGTWMTVRLAHKRGIPVRMGVQF